MDIRCTEVSTGMKMEDKIRVRDKRWSEGVLGRWGVG